MADVDPTGPAAEAGIQPGDQILEVNRQTRALASGDSGGASEVRLAAGLAARCSRAKDTVPGSATQKLIRFAHCRADCS